MVAQDLQRTLLRVVQRTRAIDVRHYEWREHSALQQELLPAVIEALSDGITAFTEILDYYGCPSGGDASSAESDTADASARRVVGPINDAEDGVQRITDLSFMARWELHREQEGVGKIGSRKVASAVISGCGRACKRVVTSAIAVEDAICAYEGLNSILHHLHTSELGRSLQIRRAYALFRQTVAGGGPVAIEDVRERLRLAAVGIAKLVGSEVYRELRYSDRMRLEAVQGRLIEWLDGRRGDDPVAGLRIWEDINHIAELLLEVNKRAELREHDHAVVAEAYTRLFCTDRAPECIPHDLQLQLQSLFGRDEECDQLIADPEPHATADWRVPLERLLGRLGPSA
ncbi:MAG: hypothetical protein ACE5IQ_07100 [Candidatus Methylomirabilales bacterium]